MFSGLVSVAVILIIFALGFFFHQRRIWPDNTPSGLSAVVIRISAPCLAVTSIVSGFTRDLLRSSLILLLVAALHILALYVAGKLLSRALRLKDGRKTIFEVTFTYSNVIFIGLPINQIVFGEEGLPFLFAYYIIILAAFWSFGYAQIAAAGKLQAGKAEGKAEMREKAANGPVRRRIPPQLSKIINPGFIGVIVGYILVEAGMKLAAPIDIAMGYLAGLTVPLSLLVIGANLTIFAKGIPRVTADEVIILLGKFVISPLIMFGLLKALGVDGLPFFVFILSSSMPCHMQTSIIAQHYGVESAYASKLVGLSTLLSLITIPIYVAGIHHFM
ncbi:MAG: AEC family transporter [Clostridiales Family XIII bacterium]|jgi:predicted permease|nr:AEC family transporter [Clostridiales Family XIII bacterium]